MLIFGTNNKTKVFEILLIVNPVPAAEESPTDDVFSLDPNKAA